MTALSAAAPLKLPVWRTVRACYAIVAGNLGQLLRIGWLWLLIMVPVYAVINWMDWAQKEVPWALGPGDLTAIVELPFLASIAVAWHRLVLRQERVTAPAYLRFDRTVWLYALYSLLLMLLVTAAAAPLLVRAVPDGTLGGPVAVMLDAHVRDLFGSIAILLAVQVVAMLPSLIVAALVPRLSLVLPALALGDRLSPARSWRLTRGNTLRLALATLLCILPGYLLGVLVVLSIFAWDQTAPLQDGAVGADDRAFFTVLGFIISVSFAVLAILAVTLLSLTYRFFVGQREESATPPA